jgi:hypothetical protein
VTRSSAPRRHGGGRPPRPASARHSVPLTTWVKPGELARILHRVAEANLSVSAYLRTAALRVTINPPSVPRVNLRLLGDLGRVGNNLNQLVHAIHAGRAAPGLLTVLNELLVMLQTVRRELIGLQSPPRDREGHQGDGFPGDA